MTAYQALSLALQFGLLQITTLTFIVTIVVYLTKKK
ncbi:MULTISPECIES: putative holin-like toxin [Bacillaceae]|nr:MULTISPECIES: putative holin-like toxin [Bacillaceae]